MNESRAAPEVPQSRRSPEGPPAERDASSRLLQFVTDRVPAMIGYWDSALRNRFGNKAYLEWFGLTPEQMRGRHIREVIGEDLFAKNRPFLEGALAGVPQHFDRTIVDAAGRTRHTQASYLPDVDDSGRIQGLVALVTDVTERVRVERQLAEREQLQRAIIDGSPIGLAVVELDGRWTQVNPALCRLLGYSPEQMMSGMTFQDITHPDDLDADLALAARLLDGTLDSYELEKRYLHADGHEVWIQMHGSLIRDEEGRPCASWPRWST